MVSRRALAILILAGCSSSGGGSDAARGEGSVAASGRAGSPAPPPPSASSGTKRAGPFEQARRALFEREEEVSLPSCSDDGACIGSGAPGAAARTVRRVVGSGGRPLFYGDDVRFLIAEPRAEEALRAIDAAIHAAPGESPVRRLLLQNDAWERFDALGKVEPDHPRIEAARALQRRIANLVRALALTPDEVKAIPSNLGILAKDFADELGGLDEPGRWLEVRTTSRDGPPSTPLRVGARHDLRAGMRMAFRVLVRMPEDGDPAATLQRHLDDRDAALPIGTRLALVGSPLVLTAEGEVAPTRLVTVVEARRVIAKPYPRYTDRPFDVFEADADADADGAARLRRVAADEPIPMGATCAPTVGTLVPMRAACLMCHAQVGERLTGPMAHGDTVFELETDRDAAGRRVAAEKVSSPAMRELLTMWPDRR